MLVKKRFYYAGSIREIEYDPAFSEKENASAIKARGEWQPFSENEVQNLVKKAMEMETYVVTHPGVAHTDEFLASCIILAQDATVSRIERREPTEAELNDPNVYVVDQGGKFETNLRNFDHHHDANLSCSFNLIIDYFNLLDTFKKAYKWFDEVDLRDRKGAKAEKDRLGVSSEGTQAWPIHVGILKQFAKQSKIASAFIANLNAEVQKNPISFSLFQLMLEIGKDLIEHAKSYQTAWDKLEKCEVYDIVVDKYLYNEAYLATEEVKMLVSHHNDEAAGLDFCRKYGIAVMVSPDKRGDGWQMFRIDDHPRVDFAKIGDEDDILFAHKAGFIAKTKAMISHKALLDLANKAICPR